MLPAMRTCVLAIAASACTPAKPAGGDWAARPFDTVSGEVGDGHGAKLSYSLQVPHGLAVVPHANAGITVGYEVSPRDFTAPNVMIGYDAIAPASLDEVVKSTTVSPSHELVRSEAIDGGYLLVLRAKSHLHWSVDVAKVAGDRGVSCMAQQASDRAELGDASRQLLEKICRSLTIDHPH
jgi:hypothetical protein